MKNQKELSKWLRNNNSGIYRSAGEALAFSAADEIERLQKELDSAKYLFKELGESIENLPKFPAEMELEEYRDMWYCSVKESFNQ